MRDVGAKDKDFLNGYLWHFAKRTRTTPPVSDGLLVRSLMRIYREQIQTHQRDGKANEQGTRSQLMGYPNRPRLPNNIAPPLSP